MNSDSFVLKLFRIKLDDDEDGFEFDACEDTGVGGGFEIEEEGGFSEAACILSFEMLLTASLKLLTVFKSALSGKISLSSASSNPTENRISNAPAAGSSFSSMVLLVSFTARYLVLLGSLSTLPRSLTRMSLASFITVSELSASIDTMEVSTGVGAA